MGRTPARTRHNDGPREDAMTRLTFGAALAAALLLLAPVSFAENAVPMRTAQAQTAAPATRPQALVASPLPAAAPEDVGMSRQKLDRIHAVLQQEIDSGKLPG